MNKEEFSRIRCVLGKTQKQMSQILCVSAKAIQSFEQGWRNIPAHIAREMLLLYSLKKSPDAKIQACWEVKNCPNDWREKCIVWELKANNTCWYLNGTFCEGQVHSSWEAKMQLCRECRIYKSNFGST